MAGLQLDPGPLSLALIGERAVVPAVRDAEQFRVPGGEAALLAALAEAGDGSETLQFVRATAREAYRTAGKLEAAVSGHRGLDAYPRTELGRRLWQIARLTQSGFGARVYSAVLSGFDTHGRQRQPHATLLKTAADAIAAFFQDLKSSGLDRRVLLMTYSEFGRRVAENPESFRMGIVTYFTLSPAANSNVPAVGT